MVDADRAWWRPAEPSETPGWPVPRLTVVSGMVLPNGTAQCTVCGDPLPFGVAHYCARRAGYVDRLAA